VPRADLPAELVAHARLAATACPTLALLIDRPRRRHG
jgi:ferredoxin